jgi:hypothetical protein
MIWLEMMIMRARYISAISFVEQPPTYEQAFAVQRFQHPRTSFGAAAEVGARQAFR